jgi:primosomal protein DnaI
MKVLPFKKEPIETEKLIDNLLEDDVLREFFILNDLNTETIERNLSLFFNFKVEKDRCNGCESFAGCKQDTLGFEPVLKMGPKGPMVQYQHCHFAAKTLQEKNKEELLDALYMPQMIQKASLEDFDFTRGDNRTIIHNRLITFIQKYLHHEDVKGLYLHGPYQRGKTYCLAALANELSLHGVHTIIAYYPDLVREFKSRINDNSVEYLISKLKQVDVLMLDDIGGESQSIWIRDEVLGPILQYRLLDHKPTFFSSNLSQRQLANVLVTNSQTAEKMKAARIEARIKSLSEEIQL